MDCLDLWTLQKEELHGNNSASKQLKLANEALQDLRAIYQLQNEVLALDRHLFSKPLDTFLEEDNYSIQCGIRSHKGILYQIVARPNANQSQMFAYFQPTSIPFQVNAPNATKQMAQLRKLRSTRMPDQYHHTPSIPATIPKSNLQNQILIHHFQQLPLIFPNDPYITNDPPSWWVYLTASSVGRIAI
jgi:hypothetical protein